MIEMSGAKKKSERRALKAEIGLTEREKQELKKQQAQRRNSILALVGGIVVVVLVAALLIWNSGWLDRHTTAVKFAPTGETGSTVSFTRADMNYFYYQAINTYRNQEAALYQQYGMEYTPSFDTSTSLKTQYMDADQTMSYYDYFMQQSMADAKYTAAFTSAAQAEGYTLSEDAQAALDSAPASLDSAVTQSGYGTRSVYLKAMFGRSMTEKVYFQNLERYLLAQDYYSSKVAGMNDYTDEELQAYYDEHTNELDSYDYTFAYFDSSAPESTDADGNPVEATDEENAAAATAAETNSKAMLAALQSGLPTTFSAAAEQFGGDVTEKSNAPWSEVSMQPFADWVSDSARAEGDLEWFESEGVGYYVVQYHGRSKNEAPSSADVRHILISTSHEDDPETADVDESTVPFTAEETAAAEAEAARILEEFSAGDRTAERFGELAEQYSQDTRNEDGSLVAAGGLYEDVTPSSSYVQEFLDWIFTPGRSAGDTGVIKTDYGYHIMYLESAEDVQWIASAKSGLLTADEDAYLDEVDAGMEAVENHWYEAEDAQATDAAEASEASDAAEPSEAAEPSPAN